MNVQEIKRTIGISLWFVFLTFPIMVIRVNQVEDDLAVAEIIRDWEKLPLRKGDRVFFTGS